MGVMLFGIGLNLLATFYIYFFMSELRFNSGANELIGIVVLSWFISLVGGMLSLAKKRNIGAKLVILGSLIFLPLGMVAIIGAVKAKETTQGDLELRRRAAKQNNQ